MRDIVHETGPEQFFGVLSECGLILILESSVELKHECGAVVAESIWVIIKSDRIFEQHHPDSDSTGLLHNVVILAELFF